MFFKQKNLWGADDFRELILGNRFWFFYEKKKNSVSFQFGESYS